MSGHPPPRDLEVAEDELLVAPPGPGEAPLDPAGLFEGQVARIELEIGCGKGRFLLEAASRWPERGFVALEVSRKLVRLVRDRARRAGLSNVRLLLADARLLVKSGLREESLSRVHVYCPDPWPKRRHAERRLFAPPFATDLARVLRPEGELLLTSDFDPYFREVAARLAAHPEWVRTTTQPFAELPAGGFDAIFASEGIPVFRGCWQRRADSHPSARRRPQQGPPHLEPVPEKTKAR